MHIVLAVTKEGLLKREAKWKKARAKKRAAKRNG